jgi:hypothetical protein
MTRVGGGDGAVDPMSRKRGETCGTLANRWRSDFFWCVGIGLADGGVGIFWGGRRFLDGRRHGLGGDAEMEGRE